MNAQLTINGQTISIELTQDQIEQLTKKKSVKKWEDLKTIEGYFIDNCGEVDSCRYASVVHQNKKIYATENQARSSLAMAQLSQLMKHVNGDWKPVYEGINDHYIIDYWKKSINTDWGYSKGEFLTFPTAKIRDQFLEDHRELIEEYFLMYK